MLGSHRLFFISISFQHVVLVTINITAMHRRRSSKRTSTVRSGRTTEQPKISKNCVVIDTHHFLCFGSERTFAETNDRQFFAPHRCRAWGMRFPRQAPQTLSESAMVQRECSPWKAMLASKVRPSKETLRTLGVRSKNQTKQKHGI